VRQVSLRVVFLMCVLLGALAIPAYAQDATIVGTVTDPTGAAVPNAAITLTNVETGQVRQSSSNNVGQFVVPELRIGHYTVRVQVAGFKVVEQKDVVLAVGDRLRLDFKLEIGTAQEQVTVEATPIAVQSDSGEISDVITGQQITQLSTNGRSIYSLAALTPGASSIMADAQLAVPVGGDANVSFNGNRMAHNIYLIDGGEDLDRGGAGTISVMPSVDAIAEFRTLTANYSADYGLSSAATLTMVFRSGEKQFHATAWEFLRNDKLDARNFFGGATKNERRLNVFGFNIGGPVTFGSIYNKEREKTFFFYNMEWRRQVLGGLLNQVVPPTSAYGGNFGSTSIHTPCSNQLSAAEAARFTGAGLALSTCTSSGAVTTAVPFPSNTIPSSLLDANAKVLLAAGIFPAQNNGSAFRGGNNAPTNVREEIIRIDHRFTDKFSVFGHWVDDAILQTYGTTMWSGDNVPSIGNTFGNPSYSGVIHSVYSISPTLVNELAFNYNGNRINILPVGIYAKPSGLTTPELFPGNADNRMPGIQLSGSTGTNYSANWVPWVNKADDYQIREDLSWTKGSHQLKMGASWALYKKIQDLFAPTQGAFSFNGSYTGNDFADFLLGYSNSYQEYALQDHGYWNNVSWAMYLQDNWRVNKRLTLNLGLRWDGAPHTYEANNRMANFVPSLYSSANMPIFLPDGTISSSSPGLGTSPNPLLAGMKFYLNGVGITGQNGVPKGMVNNHWAAFGPRLGFAYDLTGSGKTLLRGGFGMMYERVQGNDMYQAAADPPFTANVTLNNVYLSNPNKNILSGATMTAPITVNSLSGLFINDYKLPVSFQYSAGVQQALGARSVLSVAYVGTQGRHQSDNRNINLPDPSTLASIIGNGSLYNTLVPYRGYNSITMGEDSENAHYNSLQVSLRAQVRNDLTLQAAYTLSRSWDPGNLFQQDGGDLCNVSNPYNRAYDNGLSLFDRTNILVANFIYKLPIFNHTQNQLLKSTLGGWELSGIVTMESGTPLNVTLGGAAGGNGVGGTNRPNLNGSVSYPGTQAQWFNTSAFSAPTIGQWGNAPHNAVRGPGRDNWNLSLFKSFVLNEARGSRFELRVESYNAFNHTQFQGVSTSFTDSRFGQLTSAYDARDFQVGAKLYF